MSSWLVSYQNGFCGTALYFVIIGPLFCFFLFLHLEELLEMFTVHLFLAKALWNRHCSSILKMLLIKARRCYEGFLVRRGRDTRDASAQRKGRVRTHCKGGHLQAQERGLRRNQSCWHFALGFLAPRTVRKFLLFEPATARQCNNCFLWIISLIVTVTKWGRHYWDRDSQHNFAHSRNAFGVGSGLTLKVSRWNALARKWLRWGEGLNGTKHFPDTCISLLVVSNHVYSLFLTLRGSGKP